MPVPSNVPHIAVPTNNSFLLGVDEAGHFFFITVSQLATLLGGGATPDPVNPGPGTVDLRVDDVTWTPANPVEGDHVIFTALVRNYGTATMPAGLVANDQGLDVEFWLDDTSMVSFNVTYEGSLAPGASISLSAVGSLNAGLTPPYAGYWVAAQGHSITARVNSHGFKAESVTTNNKLTKTVVVTQGAGGGGTPSSTTKPDASNTGPRQATNGTITMAQWIAAGTASNKIITGVHDDQGGALLDKTLTAYDCIFTEFWYVEPSLVADVRFPHITMDHCRIEGGIFQHGGVVLTALRCHFNGQSFVSSWRDGAAEDHNSNQTNRNFPWVMTECYFYAGLPVPPSAGGFFHCEALHMVSGCVGPQFYWCNFEQEGNNANPIDNNITGVIKCTSINSIWRDCWFDFRNSGPSTYFSLNWEGRNVELTRAKAEPGVAGFFYNSGIGPVTGVFSPFGGGPANNYVLPTCTDCTDLNGVPFDASS